jgi:hypothetical protein
MQCYRRARPEVYPRQMNFYDVELLPKFLEEGKCILTDQNTGVVVTGAYWSVPIGAISCPCLLDILSSLMAQSYTLKKAEFLI